MARVLCAVLLALLNASPEAANGEPPLRETLVEIDRVAQFYSSQALRFTSDEKVVVKRGGRSQTHRFRHIYTVDEHGKHNEFREPVKRRHDPGTLRATRPYQWIFLFEAGRRAYVHYEWVGVERRLEREAIGISFRPRGQVFIHVNDWYGTAWFDSETYLPLVVEAWTPEEHERKLEFDRRLATAADDPARSRSTHVITSVRAEFAEQRNGLRLPTRVTTRERRFVVWGRDGTSGYREQTLASIKQLYTNYRFYGVSAEQRFPAPEKTAGD